MSLYAIAFAAGKMAMAGPAKPEFEVGTAGAMLNHAKYRKPSPQQTRAAFKNWMKAS